MEEKLYYAVQANDVTALRWLLEEGVNINTVFMGQNFCPFGRQSRWSALHLCCEKGHYDSAKVLLGAGADPNSYDKWNQTPLAYAIHTQWHHLVELLLTHGADVSITDRKGRSFIHFCVEYGDDMCVGESEGISDGAALVSTLLSHGADPDVGDMLERTPLWLCVCEGGHLDQIRILLEAGCDVNKADIREQRTPLQAAIMHAKKDRMKYVMMLLEKGADVNNYDNRNHNAFMNVTWRYWKEDGETMSEEDVELCQLIMQYNFQADSRPEKKTWLDYGGNALSLAVERGVAVLVEMLLNYGADPDFTDDKNNTALILSVFRKKLSCTASLLKNNADTNVCGCLKFAGQWQPMTAFQCACHYGDIDVAVLLVHAGYDLTKETYLWTNQKLPQHLRNSPELLSWLQDIVSNPRSLVDLSRKRVRCLLGRSTPRKLTVLQLPFFIQKLVLLGDVLEPWTNTFN